MTLERKHVGPRMSLLATVNGIAYTAGIVAEKRDGTSVAEQTAEILATIDSLLADAGTNKENVYKASIWLADMSTFAEMNSVWDQWVVAGKTPVRATTEAKLALPELLVEIQVEAVI
jgi:enamine deaminase RidA (YjgF/YER057c/UK114 family)